MVAFNEFLSIDFDQLARAMARLDEFTREPQPARDDAPIFLASTGWRTGSTLLQRALMTDSLLLLWGEPVNLALMVARTTQALTSVREQWPDPAHWISHRGEVNLTQDWVATMAADPGYFKAGLRALFDTWWARPARDRGFPRWGVKEVRWTGQDALTLKWLYPKAHFVLITRDPVASWRSLLQWDLNTPDIGMWIGWPNHFVHTPQTYAEYWNALALTWREAADRLPVTIVRYEDLIAGKVDLIGLGEEVGLTLEPQIALETVVGGNPYQHAPTSEERDLILKLTEQGRAALGYQV